VVLSIRIVRDICSIFGTILYLQYYIVIFKQGFSVNSDCMFDSYFIRLTSYFHVYHFPSLITTVGEMKYA
jgi:hypothetical protein